MSGQTIWWNQQTIKRALDGERVEAVREVLDALDRLEQHPHNP